MVIAEKLGVSKSKGYTYHEWKDRR